MVFLHRTLPYLSASPVLTCLGGKIEQRKFHFGSLHSQSITAILEKVALRKGAKRPRSMRNLWTVVGLCHSASVRWARSGVKGFRRRFTMKVCRADKAHRMI